MRLLKPASLVVAAMALLMLFGCGDAPTALSDDLAQPVFRVVGGDNQMWAVGEELPDPLVAKLTDKDGNPRVDYLVSWIILEGGGSVWVPSTVTNNKGKTRNRWTLGADVGRNVIEVRSINPSNGKKRKHGTFEAMGMLRNPVAATLSEQIAIMTEHAEHLTTIPLTHNSACPSWSPGGRKLAAHRFTVPEPEDPGNWDIWSLNPDGTGLTNLTNTKFTNEWHAAWSPDGSKIAFSRGETPETANIYLMNADGAGLEPLTIDYGDQPAWSPDGAELVYMCIGQRLCFVSSDGMSHREIALEHTTNMSPDWSPDGSRIVFKAEGAGLYVVNPDGSDLQLVVESATALYDNPRWSPDGTVIAYDAPLGALPGWWSVYPDGSQGEYGLPFGGGTCVDWIAFP